MKALREGNGLELSANRARHVHRYARSLDDSEAGARHVDAASCRPRTRRRTVSVTSSRTLTRPPDRRQPAGASRSLGTPWGCCFLLAALLAVGH
eukprot:3047299-Prymnesium_polylepis.2